MKFSKIKPIALLLLICCCTAYANPSNKLIESFVEAMSAANQPSATQHDIEQYLTYLTDDFTDYHAAYHVTQSGKENALKNKLKKVENMKSFQANIEDIILGTDTAVMVINEDSVYLKQGEIKNFKGRTIWVLEFDEHNKIHHVRRYLDWN
ncbi:MAG: nuclear transport factor 2 family protein [Marinicella sp.]